ncbi:MAG: cytosine permease [Chloroflexi bacterium]|nr:MAG: cytosine permease [Chloroflexota bacterium]
MTAGLLTGQGMPSREGDLSIEGHGMEPIPETARYGSVNRLFTVWFSPNLVPAAFFVGTLAAADFIGLGWWTGLAAIIVGNVIGAGLVGYLSAMGPQFGMAQIPASRLPFGKSIVLPGILNWLSTIAWDAINAFFGAYAISVVTGDAVPFPLGLLIVIACQAALSVVGYEAIHTFERYAAIGLAILFAVVTVAVAGKANLGLADGAASGIGSFILMTTIAGSFNLAWALYASDYSRYLPANTPRSQIFSRTFLGLGLGAIWMEALGLAVVSALGNETDTVHQINALVGGGLIGILAMVAIFFGTVAVNSMNDYTGSLSLQAAGLKVARPVSAAIVAVLSFLATLYLYANNFASTVENYLLVITYWIGPWAAVVIVDWRRRGSRTNASRAVDFSLLPSGRNALIALVVGFVASIPFMNQTLFVGPLVATLGGADIAYLVGFVVAAVIFSVLENQQSTAVALD